MCRLEAPPKRNDEHVKNIEKVMEEGISGAAEIRRNLAEELSRTRLRP